MNSTKNYALGMSVLLTSMMFLGACKKEKVAQTPQQPSAPLPANTEITNGFPANKKAVDGYLYASYESDYNGVGTTRNIYGFAVFSSNPRDLSANYDHQLDKILNNTPSANIGNLVVGDVSFSGNTLFNSGSSTSTDVNFMATSANFDYATRWTTLATASNKALDVNVTRGFPIILLDQTKADTLSINNGFTFNFTNVISNYDSVTVRLSNSPSKLAFGIQKTVASPATSIAFSKNELSSTLIAAPKAYIFFRAFNYSNQRIENKVYMFELSNKLVRKLVVKP